MESLEANHINKILSDLDPVNLEWLCKSCHKYADSATAKGVSSVGDEYGYRTGVAPLKEQPPPVGESGYGY
jgi:hypothetical protein